MPATLDNAQLEELCRLEYHIEEHGARGWWLRLDVWTATGQPQDEVFEIYLDLQTELAEIGLRLTDPQLERDCVSGYLGAVLNEDDFVSITLS